MGYLLLLAVFIIVLLWLASGGDGLSVFVPPKKRAGNRGERIAEEIIRKILQPDDLHLTNVKVVYECSKTELDNIIVNQNGVFIIEVKNYNGILRGGEDDYNWEKHKTTSAGNTYEMTVKNPIKQVRRQTYILANYLRNKLRGSNIRVWVEGYVYFVQGNSPVGSDMVLKTTDDIKKAVHKPGPRRLSEADINAINGLLKRS